jgi:Prokaryotic N-terminal methylation motif
VHALERRRGFGLLEVMISGSILLVGVAAVVTTVNLIERQYAHQRYVTNAIHVAEGTLEELLGRWPTDPELVPAVVFFGSEYDSRGLVTAPGTGFFTTEWVVTAGVPIATTREVRVTVRWFEEGVPRQFQLRGVRS